MNDFLWKALNLVSVVVIIINSDNQIVFWNKVLEKLSGIPMEQAIGQRLTSVCPAFDKPLFLPTSFLGFAPLFPV